MTTIDDTHTANDYSPSPGVTVHANGGMTLEGDGIIKFRMLTFKSACELELATNGAMRMTRGPSAFTLIKQEFKIGRGNSRKAKLAAYLAFCERFALQPQAKYVTEYSTL